MKIKINRLNLEDFREGDLFGFGRKSRCFIIEEINNELFAIDQGGYGGKLKTIIDTSKELPNIYNRLYLFGNIHDDKRLKYEYGFGTE